MNLFIFQSFSCIKENELMSAINYVIGIDYGTASVRSVIVDANNGNELASSEFTYPRWKEGKFCDLSKNQFRQHPLDYIEGLEYTVKSAVHQVSDEVRKNIRAISIDTTGSTPIAVNEAGVPLALLPEFKENPNAMFFLWKDHTSIKEANEINQHAKKFEIDYLKYVGGIYSSEWFWAKLLNVLRTDENLRSSIYSWVEHCDWMPFLLTGKADISEMKRSVCSAGHKALWSEEFGGLPPQTFFSSLDPLLDHFVERLYENTYTADTSAGQLSAEWTERLGLTEDVKVGVGAMDAHMGAVGGEIEPFYLSKVMGTSTCDMLAIPKDQAGNILVEGICGQVDGSVIPGMIGMEAGQSAFGDIYEWFQRVVTWPIKNYLDQNPSEPSEEVLKNIMDTALVEMSKAAEKLTWNEKSELSLDWLNGRRTPDANQLLKGAIQGLHLGSNAPQIFRSLVEGTCFGAKRIIERFVENKIPIKGIIGIGGVAHKSPFIMQMMADILEIPIKIHKSEQTCALGASMFAATVAGLYPDVREAMKQMGQGFQKEYTPNKERIQIYRKRYEMYKEFCDFVDK